MIGELRNVYILARCVVDGYPYAPEGLLKAYTGDMADNKPQSETPMQTFTRAVKTIVSVPKSEIKKR